MGQTDEATQIAEVIARVAQTYPDRSNADIARVVQTLHAGFTNAKIREFVPLLVEREARAVLADTGRGSTLAQASGVSRAIRSVQPGSVAVGIQVRHLLHRLAGGRSVASPRPAQGDHAHRRYRQG